MTTHCPPVTTLSPPPSPLACDFPKALVRTVGGGGRGPWEGRVRPRRGVAHTAPHSGASRRPPRSGTARRAERGASRASTAAPTRFPSEVLGGRPQGGWRPAARGGGGSPGGREHRRSHCGASTRGLPAAPRGALARLARAPASCVHFCAVRAASGLLTTRRRPCAVNTGVSPRPRGD